MGKSKPAKTKAKSKKIQKIKPKKTKLAQPAKAKKANPKAKLAKSKTTDTKSAKTNAASLKSAKVIKQNAKAGKTSVSVAKSKSSAGLKHTKSAAKDFNQKTSKNSKVLTVSLSPLDDRIVVQIEKGEKLTPGGLYIPETAQMSGNLKGRVLAIGKGHRTKKGKIHPMDVKIGDQVLFSEYVGTKTQLEGLDVCILRESEILGKMES
jgi:chaperonin GroES